MRIREHITGWSSGPWGRYRYAFGTVVVLLVIVSGAIVARMLQQDTPVTTTSAPRQRPAAATDFSQDDAVTRQARSELRAFALWLQDQDARGYIGEFGWPATADARQWSAVGDRWLQDSEAYGLWATAWAAGSWWGEYPLATHVNKSLNHRQLSVARSQASILHRYPTNQYGDRRGVNVAGMEFGEEALTNTNPGQAGRDYFYEPAASFAYLARQGVDTVRLPFRWERIQPVLGGALDTDEIGHITDMLDAAERAGIQVILDLHNYGEYRTDGAVLRLGDGVLAHEALVDVWKRLSRSLGSHPAVLAYGLMNEPHDLPTGGYDSPAKNWEAASQAVVSALRTAGDNSLVMVAGYDWSSLARWSQNHPAAWITDPAEAVRYEAHHYWDADGSGHYDATYADELTRRTP